MRKPKHRRPLALLLCAVLLTGQPGATAYAEEAPHVTAGLCEHHPAHDASCGYAEAVEGHDCEHIHTPECYTGELICGYADGEVQAVSGSDAGHQNGQECYRLDCPHERGGHDTACGYIEGVTGTPCGYVCTECGGEPDKDSGTASGNNLSVPIEETATETVEPEGAETITVTAFEELDGGVKVQTVLKGAKLESLTLPDTLGASGHPVADGAGPVPGAIIITGVTWEPTGENDTPTAYEDGRTSPCSYYFQPVLPEGYTLAEGAALPRIEVRYGWGTRARANTSGYNTDDIRAFKQILTDHPELKSIPGVDEDDPASWQPAGLVTWDATQNRLTSLYLADRSLTGALDVSGLKALVFLNCADNAELTGLKLGTQDQLAELRCYKTGISGMLDVSDCPQLKSLGCYENAALTELKLGTHNQLISLSCYATGINGTLDVSSYPQLQTLSCYENAALTELKLGTHNQLISLSCYATGINGTLDVSNCPQLKTLLCYDNAALTELKLGTHNQLTDLQCYTTGISGMLDVSNCPRLTILWCYDNAALTELKLGAHNQLTDLQCYTTGISGTLDVSNCPRLQALKCYENAALTELRLGRQNQLTDLECYTTGIKGTLDVSNCPQLKNLWCNGNAALTELKLGTHNQLAELRCATTGISGTLDVSNCPRLVILWCSDNAALTELKLGQQDDLIYLQCYTTGISGMLDVSNCPRLQALQCYDNAALTELKLGTHNQLTYLSCYATGISGTLDVSNYPLLQALWCSDNAALTELKLGTQDNLDSLFCTNTGLSGTLDLSRLARLTALSYNGKAVVLPGGTIKAEDGGKVMVQFGNVPVGTSYENVPFTLTALPDSGQQFAGWTGLPGGVDENTAKVNFTPGSGYIYTARFTPDSGGSGGPADDGENNTDERNDVITVHQPPKPNTPVPAVIELPVTVENGTAAGTAEDEGTAAAIAGAQKDARARTNGIAVRYNAVTSRTYDGFSIVIQRATLDRLTAARVKYVTLNTAIVDLTFDLAALKEIAAESTGDITLTAARETGLAGDALAAVGRRPAYRLTVTYNGADGRAASVQDFGAGRVTVGLACEPAAGQAGSLFLVYSRDGKGAEWLYQSGYDRNSGSVISSVGHFSVYGVGYQPAPAFSDTVNHWARSDIDFAVSRGLLAGTGDTAFTPDGAVTRGIFVMALGRLAGIDPAAYPSGRFTDVPATAAYAPYVEWAAGEGIATGTGDKAFSPDGAVTREQMAAMMQRYAGKLGYTLPVAREAEKFVDEGQITGGMRDAVQAMQQAGVMNAKGSRRFCPGDTATRAEAAAVLRRFAEIVIDPAGAGGWGQNDAGGWLYYENGRPVTGWKQMEGRRYYFDGAGLMEYGGWKEIGGKWYYFYPEGTMAANTTIDGYEIGPDGVRME